jgi:hypothetical protein
MNQHVSVGDTLVARPLFKEANINRDVAFDAAPTTSTSERKGEVRLLALWPFVLVVAILAIIALISDGSVTPDQRIQAFQQSGVYPSRAQRWRVRANPFKRTASVGSARFVDDVSADR